VDQSYSVLMVEMWVRIPVSFIAMGSPPSMANTNAMIVERLSHLTNSLYAVTAKTICASKFCLDKLSLTLCVLCD
jgi:hypothetical protein